MKTIELRYLKSKLTLTTRIGSPLLIRKNTERKAEGRGADCQQAGSTCAGSVQEDDFGDVLYLSPLDELANSLTHGLGTLFSLVAVVAFWRWTAEYEFGLRICCQLFTTAMVIVYTFSTLSHAVHQPLWRNRLRAWDQGTIYLLICGTYSPFIWCGSPDGLRMVLLAIVWLAGVAGFCSKVLSAHRINAVSTISYVLLGWLPALPLIPKTPTICFAWMLLGGVSYTLGILLLIRSSRIRFSHAGWHLMVMLGSACHCYAVYRLLQLTPTL